jgi:TnpA family transposase
MPRGLTRLTTGSRNRTTTVLLLKHLMKTSNESDLRIEEHYTDTAGFMDHVSGLCHLLGFRFAPRIRDLADRRLYTVKNAKSYPVLVPFYRRHD